MTEIKRQESTHRMSRIVEHGETIYLCGQTAKDSTKGIKEQTVTTLEKVDELLQKAGSDRNHILSVTIYLRDMKDFAQMNEVWDEWISNSEKPARACVEARLAREELLVELSVVAAKI
ncbi:MAG: RidA family protein [Marinifilaceae bacterium]|jgi:enamine deaminase RidA (YjgF/YER057c/UK114 family)|nr:RidA family protein [Marinifilaceae bacterium]